MFSFEILAEDGDARAGRLVTRHGVIETPSFVTVGTLGAVRGVSVEELRIVGTQAIIANAFHLYLRPGKDLISNMGGLHRFMGWEGPLMTDSGGFQIFSLGASREHGVGKIASIFPGDEAKGEYPHPRQGRRLVEIDDEGAEFISYLDGSRHRFTPEGVISLQTRLGADIILVLDECTSPLHDRRYTGEAMERTHQWALRSLEAFGQHRGTGRALFGIVQGGAFRDLREESARFLSGLDFDGYAVGGSLGKSREDMHRVLEWVVPLLPRHRPRHLLGIGTVADILEVVARGIDLFDCIAPTLMAGTGTVFTRQGDGTNMNLLNARYREDPGPIEEGCGCPACGNYSRAYLRHLFVTKEPAAQRLASIHNLCFVESLMKEIRKAIRDGRFQALLRKWGNGSVGS